MKIAFPAAENRGVNSLVYDHFGSARFFILIRTDNGEIESIVNQNGEHKHGQCQPLLALGGSNVDAVVVGGIGGEALRKLRSAGIRVYRAAAGTVQENLELIRSGRLTELAMDQSCVGHGPGGDCAH